MRLTSYRAAPPHGGYLLPDVPISKGSDGGGLTDAALLELATRAARARRVAPDPGAFHEDLALRRERPEAGVHGGVDVGIALAGEEFSAQLERLGVSGRLSPGCCTGTAAETGGVDAASTTFSLRVVSRSSGPHAPCPFGGGFLSHRPRKRGQPLPAIPDPLEGAALPFTGGVTGCAIRKAGRSTNFPPNFDRLPARRLRVRFKPCRLSYPAAGAGVNRTTRGSPRRPIAPARVDSQAHEKGGRRGRRPPRLRAVLRWRGLAASGGSLADQRLRCAPRVAVPASWRRKCAGGAA